MKKFLKSLAIALVSAVLGFVILVLLMVATAQVMVWIQAVIP